MRPAAAVGAAERDRVDLVQVERTVQLDPVAGREAAAMRAAAGAVGRWSPSVVPDWVTTCSTSWCFWRIWTWLVVVSGGHAARAALVGVASR